MSDETHPKRSEATASGVVSQHIVGFIGPPGWDDPSPDEFARLTGVSAIGMTLDLGEFDWSLDRIATTEPTLVEAAVTLAGRGACVIGIVGTPFGWAGLAPRESPRDRSDRIASECGVPVVSAVAGMLGWLDDLGVSAVALAAPYYDAEWCDRWAKFVADAGYGVTSCVSMADVGIAEPLSAADETHWAPTPEQIERTVIGALCAGDADAVMMSGAGARTLGCLDRLRAATGRPVVTSDLGLYRAVCQELGIADDVGIWHDSPEHL